LVFVCEELEAVVEDAVVEVVLAPFEAGVVCSAVPPGEVGTGVFTVIGRLDEPAETVDMAVAIAPLAAWLHAKRTAGTPPPSKEHFSKLNWMPEVSWFAQEVSLYKINVALPEVQGGSVSMAMPSAPGVTRQVSTGTLTDGLMMLAW